jgi:serine/threonine protein kinase
MPLPVEETVATLDDLGIVPEEEARQLLSQLRVRRHDLDGAALIEELARLGRLTKYQVEALTERPPKPLLLSNYLLLDLIGSGGMGRVFKALHRRMERVVAIKVLHEKSLTCAEAVERFHREAKAAARLHHPHIVAAFDADEDHGLHFLVMEYVEGRDLASLTSPGPLPLSKAVRYIAQAARGLEYAHSEGVIHRDIKPANLLVNGKGVVKILDMGIARFAETDDPESAVTKAQLTQSGAILGTVDFLAPEQAANSKDADHRSDIYSLGCTLYYVLAGGPLHSGKTIVEKIIAHREREAPSLLAVRPDAPPALDDLIRRMTARRPSDRIASATEVAQTLEALLAEAGPSWSEEFDLPGPTQVLAPDSIPLPQTATMQLSSETLGGSRTNAMQALERFIDGCAAVDGYFDLDEEHAVFRKAGELNLSLEDVQTILDQRCRTKGWIRHSTLTEQLKQMLEELARGDGLICQREFDRLIRHAVSQKMPRRAAEEHCLTLMLNHHWPAKEAFWNRWFTRRCRKYALE